MRKKKFCKLTAVVSSFLCFVLLFNTVAFAADSQPNAVVESISIYNRSGILEGETIQLKADVEASSSVFESVEWSSSDPSVISCTEDGKIKGLVAGKAATITCKAKWGSQKVSIKVYCVERLPDEVKSGFEKKIAFIYQAPNSRIKDISLDLRYFFSPFNIAFEIFAEFFAIISSNVITDNKVSVVGKFKNYAYIRYGENNSQDGFVKYTVLKNKVDGFLNLSATQISLWADGNNYTTGILTTDYNGDVEWKVDDEDYASYDDETGQITGKIPGKVVTVTATADGMTAECKVRLLYKWSQTWVTETNKNTYLYRMKGTEFFDTHTLHTGTEFTVYGDCGTNDGWVFGFYKIGSSTYWGYVPIADVSTKGTISQYNAMNYRWPVNDTNIKKISSPFGPRSTSNGGNHKGFDIVSDTAGAVEGESVVASYNGTIMKIYIDNNRETSHGNAIVITTDKIDPVSGKNLTAIYMHLSRWNTNSSGNIVVDGKELKEGDSVAMGQLIGCAGNTGYNTSGAHLHYEVNNQNAAIRSGSNNPFTQTINPIYFYMDMDNSITKSDICEAASNGNGFYWYGENK